MKIKLQATLGLVIWRAEGISSALEILLCCGSAEEYLFSFSSIIQYLFINLASVTGRRFSNPPHQQALAVGCNFCACSKI